MTRLHLLEWQFHILIVSSLLLVKSLFDPVGRAIPQTAFLWPLSLANMEKHPSPPMVLLYGTKNAKTSSD
jgi:hypothetical protein